MLQNNAGLVENRMDKLFLKGLSGPVDGDGFKNLEGLKVSVDELVYQPQVLTAPDRPHCFAYYISIANETDHTVTLKGRKWVVQEASGEVTAVEGDGLVGEMPTLEPGGSFSYNSFHVIHSRRAIARGSYIGLDETGRRVLAVIPAFEMVVPDQPEVGYA
jgi:ApaG protein